MRSRQLEHSLPQHSLTDRRWGGSVLPSAQPCCFGADLWVTGSLREAPGSKSALFTVRASRSSASSPRRTSLCVYVCMYETWAQILLGDGVAARLARQQHSTRAMSATDPYHFFYTLSRSTCYAPFSTHQSGDTLVYRYTRLP